LLVVFLAGAIIGSRYAGVPQTRAVDDFGQPEFGAAVAFACGHGFVNPRGDYPALSAFLMRQTDRMSCADLGADFHGVDPNFTQRLYRYLMLAVGVTWKWTGLSWSGLTPLFGLMFALTLCAVYGLFRLAGGPLTATLGVVPLAASAHHLSMLPALRDYAKAPFLLLLMLVMAWLAMPPFSRVRTVALSAAFGLILGIGFGFRNDILISLPPFIAVMTVLLPVKWREEVRLKAACVALAAVVFVVSAWPILHGYGEGSNTGHVAVLGLTTGFDDPLGVTRPPYDVGTLYNDRYAGAVIGSRSSLRTGTFAAYLSPEYDREAVDIVLGVTRHWPADIFVRAIASTLTVLDFPFTTGKFTDAVPPGLSGAFAVWFYHWQAAVLKMLVGLGPLLAAGAIIVIGSSSVRNAVILLLLALYYCGYPAIQFHVRHFFHLEFIAWWALLFLAATLVRVVVARARREPLRGPLRTRAAGAIGTAGITAAIVLAPLWTLRAYQQAHVPRLVHGLQALPRRPLTVTRTLDGDSVHVTLNGLWGAVEPQAVYVRYLAAEFSSDACGAEDLPVRLAYRTGPGRIDYSSLRRIPIDPAAPTELYAPVYLDADVAEFAELQIPAGYDSCLKSVGVVPGLGPLPVQTDFVVTPHAAGTSWFQRLVQWENAPLSPTPSIHARPANLVAPRHPEPLMPPHADYVLQGLSPAGRGWSGSGTAYVPEARMLQFAEQDVPAGGVLRATGVLRRGGLQIGVLQGGQWFAREYVDTMGPFTVLVGVTRPGRYGVLVADFSTRDWRLESGSILRAFSRYGATWLLKEDFDLSDISWTRPGA
jgi:hypothetical protein